MVLERKGYHEVTCKGSPLCQRAAGCDSGRSKICAPNFGFEQEPKKKGKKKGKARSAGISN